MTSKIDIESTILALFDKALFMVGLFLKNSLSMLIIRQKACILGLSLKFHNWTGIKLHHSEILPPYCQSFLCLLEGLYTNEVASMVRVNGHHEGSMPLGKSQLLLQKTRVRSKLGALVCTVIHFDLISVQWQNVQQGLEICRIKECTKYFLTCVSNF